MLIWDQFLREEQSSLDTIDLKRVYIDMVGDLVAGAMLSQVIYWHLPNTKGQSKLRIKKQGRIWWAVSRQDWAHELRITPRQADRGLKIMAERGLIEMSVFRFDGSPTTHIWLNAEAFLTARHEAQETGCAWLKGHICEKVKSISRNGDIADREDGPYLEVISNSPIGDIDLTDPGVTPHQSVRSITETTAKTSSETTTENDRAAPLIHGARPDDPAQDTEETGVLAGSDQSPTPPVAPPAGGWDDETLARLKKFVAEHYPSTGDQGQYRPNRMALDLLATVPFDRAKQFAAAVKNYARAVEGAPPSQTRGLTKFLADDFWLGYTKRRSEAGKQPNLQAATARDINAEADAVSHAVKRQNTTIRAFEDWYKESTA